MHFLNIIQKEREMEGKILGKFIWFNLCPSFSQTKIHYHSIRQANDVIPFLQLCAPRHSFSESRRKRHSWSEKRILFPTTTTAQQYQQKCLVFMYYREIQKHIGKLFCTNNSRSIYTAYITFFKVCM